jgi:glycosyltransferase involved in cell wall biosynthesis
LVAPGDIKNNQPDAKIIFFKPWLTIGNGAFMPQLFAYIKSFDLVHLHYPFFGVHTVVALACLVFRKPLVLHYHMDAQVSGWRGWLVKFKRSTIDVILLHQARVVIGSSQDYLDNSYIGRFVSSHQAKIRILPFGVDPKLYSPSNFKKSEVLFVGALDQAHYFKGVPVLLEAISKMVNSNEWPAGFGVQIAGDGDLRVSFEQAIRDLKLTNIVYFSGKISDEALRVAYREATVLVLPSTTRGEAFGLVLIEALSSGTPVIASNLPGVRTVFHDGVEGLLVEPGDVSSLMTALKKALLDDAWHMEASLAGRKLTLEKYSWPKQAENLKKIYEDCLSK